MDRSDLLLQTYGIHLQLFDPQLYAYAYAPGSYLFPALWLLHLT